MYYKKSTHITAKVSNNAFSFEERKTLLDREPSIFIPQLVHGTYKDVELGDAVVFEEIDDGEVHSCKGLKNFVYSSGHGGLPPYVVVDNHNHAFYFWIQAYHDGLIPWGLPVVHVDQHKDMRKPETYISKEECMDITKVAEYTNTTLNVGNFIQPALANGFVTEVIMVDNSVALDSALPDGPFILDVDLDVFHEDLAYMDFDKVLSFTREAMERASFVTFATSPFFLRGEEALEWLGLLFSSS